MKERAANNLVGKHYVKIPLAFHTPNRFLVAHLSRAGSGANLNDLFLLAVGTGNSPHDVGRFSGTGHLHHQ